MPTDDAARPPETPAIDWQELTDRFAAAYERAVTELGTFNLAIFGKTGVGKSTLINALFGEEVAATGSGRPVTARTTHHRHPEGYLGVYDSEGIEVGADGDAVLAGFRRLIAEKRERPLSEQIHVIWYCVRASDLRFEDAQAEFVRALAAEGIPVLVVLTQVHRNAAGEVHPQVRELVASILERDLPLSPVSRVFPVMAVGDEWEGWSAHGLHELLDATFLVAPDGVARALTAAQRIDVARKTARARGIAKGAAGAAATAASVPIPFADATVLVPIQVTMMARIAATYGLDVKAKTLTNIAGTALVTGGATQLGRYVATSLLRLVPGANIAAGVIRAGVASSLTWGMGQAWIAVCIRLLDIGPDAADALSTADLRKAFWDEFGRRAAEEPPGDVIAIEADHHSER